MEKNIKEYLINSGWVLKDRGKVASKNFTFKNFKCAFSWMVDVGMEAERLDHHPNWFNVYNKVEVDLQTHDVGSLTKKDLTLAEYMDESFRKFL